MTLGERIRKARQNRGLSVMQLANKLEVHPHTIYLFETNKNKPRKIVLIALSQELEEDLFDSTV